MSRFVTYLFRLINRMRSPESESEIISQRPSSPSIDEDPLKDEDPDQPLLEEDTTVIMQSVPIAIRNQIARAMDEARRSSPELKRKC